MLNLMNQKCSVLAWKPNGKYVTKIQKESNQGQQLYMTNLYRKRKRECNGSCLRLTFNISVLNQLSNLRCSLSPVSFQNDFFMKENYFDVT